MDVKGKLNYPLTTVDTDTKVTDTLCSLQRTSNAKMIAGTGSQIITTNGGTFGSQQTAGAIALSGGWIYNALDAYNLDAVENEINGLDTCFSHVSGSGIYHYHLWSPCIRKNKGLAPSVSSVVPSLCKNVSACIANPASYAISYGYSGVDKQNVEIIGLGRDGHPVYGPWNESGLQWDCDKHDICNGAFLADGSYGYVSTSTFPYVVSCWGPGVGQNYKATCTKT